MRYLTQLRTNILIKIGQYSAATLSVKFKVIFDTERQKGKGTCTESKYTVFSGVQYRHQRDYHGTGKRFENPNEAPKKIHSRNSMPANVRLLQWSQNRH